MILKTQVQLTINPKKSIKIWLNIVKIKQGDVNGLSTPKLKLRIVHNVGEKEKIEEQLIDLISKNKG